MTRTRPVAVFEDSPTHLRQIGDVLGRHGYRIVAANSLPTAYDRLNTMIEFSREKEEPLADHLAALVLAGSFNQGLPRARRHSFVGPALTVPQQRSAGLFARFRKPVEAPPHVIPYEGHLSDAEVVLDVMTQYGLWQKDTENELPIIGVSRATLVPAGVRPDLDLGKAGIPHLGETLLRLEAQREAGQSPTSNLLC